MCLRRCRFRCLASVVLSTSLGLSSSLIGGENPSQPTTDIHFRLIRNQIVLEANINNRGPFNVLLDTGVVPSAVDNEVARAAKLPVDSTNSGEATGVGSDRVRVYGSEIQGLELAGVRFGNIEALVMDLSKIGGRLGVPLHGILGYSFLKERIVRINYPAKTVHVFEGQIPTSSTQQHPAAAIRLPLQFATNDIIPLLPTFFVDGRTIPVSLDTGSSLTLELFPAAVELLALQEAKERAESGSVVGARGRAEIKVARVKSLGLGGLILHDQEVAFSKRNETNSGRLGNVGNGYLKHFVLTLDYQNKVITIERPKT